MCVVSILIGLWYQLLQHPQSSRGIVHPQVNILKLQLTFFSQGANLHVNDSKYSESTRNAVCTQYTSADCEKY